MKTEGTTLDPLTRLRVAYWFNVLRTTSGMDVEELSKTPFWIDLGEFNFRLYASQRRKPSETTRKLLDKEYPGTLEAYEVGPEGLPLWKVLAGDHTTCMALVDSALAEMSDVPQRKLFFKEKVTQFWLHMVPNHYHFFSLPALQEQPENAIARAYKAGFTADSYTLAQLGKDYARPLMVAVIALWKLSLQLPESETAPMCRYLLEGLLVEALEDKFEEEIGPMLKAYLLDELAASA